MKKIYFYWLFTTMVVLCACSKDNNSITYSDATVSYFYLSHDSLPNLQNISFKIISQSRNGDTGLIHNFDSIDYNYDLTKVVMHLSYSHTPAASAIYYDADKLPSRYNTPNLQDSLVNLVGSDTINATIRPIHLVTISSNKENTFLYNIVINQHQVDPDLYIWERLVDNGVIFQAQNCEIGSVWLNKQLMLFVQDGSQTNVYTSADGSNWSTAQTPTTLPNDCRVREIMCVKNTLYYCDGDYLYTSADGMTWSKNDYSSADFAFVNTLYEFNDSIWCLAQLRSTGEYQFVNAISDGTFALTGNILPNNFPVRDYAAVSFMSISKRPRAFIIGGYDREGNTLNTRWSIEFQKNEGYRMVNYSVEQPQFTDITGASIINYNKQLLLIGGVSQDLRLLGDTIFISNDEGFHWQKADSVKNVLPKGYSARYNQAVVVDENNYIYVIGGQDGTQFFSDVYRGKLNSVDW